MYPKEAWKFKLWTEAMLRGAIVGSPQYKGRIHASKTGSKVSPTNKRHRRRRKRASRAKKD